MRQLVPVAEVVDIDDLVGTLNAQPTLAPFDEQLVDFAAALSKRLSKLGRGMPEVEALAYWMRRSELKRLAERFGELESDAVLLRPRGTVFHVPPANVDTLFVYSWLLASLVGNRNIVRLSERATDQAALITTAINESIGDYPGVMETSTMVSYGHEDELTAVLSRSCDVRIIWGGDNTVNAIRRIPIPPHAVELTFPDRFSMCAINVSAYESLHDGQRLTLAAQFFNDSYWFDQMGCSSPRLVVWVGDQAAADRAQQDFFSRVRTMIDAKAYNVEPATAVAKILQSYGSMIDSDVRSYQQVGNELTVLSVETFPQVRGQFCGGGLFYGLSVASLNDIVAHVERRDQTLSQFGFDSAELRALAIEANGRGIDRIVPIGTALNFDRFWDGYDLLQAFTRRVVIDQSNARLG